MQFSTIVLVCGFACLSVTVSALQMTPEQIGHMKEMMGKCFMESGVDPEIIERSKKGEKIDDEKLHCFGACMLQAIGVLGEDGTIYKEAAIAKIPDNFPRDKAIAVINLCSEKQGDNACKTAAHILDCLWENKGFGMLEIPEN